jgi:acetyl esterase
MMEELARVPASATIDEERATWSAFCRATNRARPADMTVTDRSVPTADWDIPVRVYRPGVAADGGPAILYIHGGGFMVGDLDTNDTLAWGLAEETGAVVVSTHYRLAPENPFPAAHDDCYAVLCQLCENAATFGIDATRLAICGDSAGGNLAATVALAARDRGGPRLVAQALLYPGFRTDGTLPSFTTYGEAPLQSAAATRKYRENYMPDPATHTNPYACPLMASDYANLPAALVHVAAIDAARDEGKLYAERMAAAGVDVVYRVAERMIHSFMRARFDGPAAAAEFRAVTGFLGARLFAAA